jgi:hypothetical protein
MTVDPMEGVSSNSTTTAAGEAAPTLHDTTGYGVGVRAMRSIGDEPWLTGVFVDGTCVLHLRLGVRC